MAEIVLLYLFSFVIYGAILFLLWKTVIKGVDENEN